MFASSIPGLCAALIELSRLQETIFMRRIVQMVKMMMMIPWAMGNDSFFTAPVCPIVMKRLGKTSKNVLQINKKTQVINRSPWD